METEEEVEHYARDTEPEEQPTGLSGSGSPQFVARANVNLGELRAGELGTFDADDPEARANLAAGHLTMVTDA